MGGGTGEERPGGREKREGGKHTFTFAAASLGGLRVVVGVVVVVVVVVGGAGG